MPRLSISILGSFQVMLDGRPVTAFRSDTVRALLAYLAVASGRARRESLAGLLWPEAPEEVARQNLRQTLSLLRKAIGDRQADPPFLQVTRKTVQLPAESEVVVDVATFTELLVACERHPHRRVDACHSCVERLRQAVELYRGDLLAGFSLPSPPFEAWLVTEREHLHLQALDALHHLAAYHERRGEHERVCHYARRQLQLEPWCEAAHRQLMRALALSDQRGAALSQYEHCRRTLMEELGVEPEEQTTRLYAEIECADGSSALQALSRTPPHNLPVPLTPFVGREAMLVEIEGLLEDPACRLLTLVGPGGSGKTRLALEAAWRQRYAFQDGIFFVPLASLDSAEAIVPTIAQAVGLSFYRVEGTSDTKEQLLDYLRHRNMLLVLDNFEHLLEGAEDATDILRAAPDVTILTTSRTELNAKGEQSYSVRGMDYPAQSVRGADVRQYSAVQLFLSSAQRVRPDLALGSDDLAHAAEICRLVEGMPLALLLAAAWVKVLAPSEIAAELSAAMPAGKGRGLALLEADVRGAPERHRSMRALFDWSWNLLGERERGILRAFSLFRGGCTREAAQAVTGASLRDLRTLVDHSLLQRTDAGRFDVHELLRQYAAERLEQAPGEEKAARDRHAAYYTASLEHWAADLKGPRQQTALGEMGTDIDNARAAWAWAAQRGHVEQLDRAAEALWLFYDWGARYGEGEATFALAANALSGTASPDGLCALVKALAWQACFVPDCTRSDRILAQCMELLARSELAGRDTRREKALVLAQMGIVPSNRRRVSEEDIGHLKQSLALYREVGDRWHTANVLQYMGLTERGRRSFGDAQRYTEEALAIARSLGDQRTMAWQLVYLGMYAHFQGQVDKGERLAREAIDVFASMGDRFDTAWSLGFLGIYLLDQGRFREARSALEESMRIVADLGRPLSTVGAQVWLGSAMMHQGLYQQAREHIASNLRYFRQLDVKLGMFFGCAGLARIAIVEGAHSQAESLLQEALVHAQEIGTQYPALAKTQFACVFNAHKMGHAANAKQHLVEAIGVAARTRDPSCPLFALVATALFLLDEGEVERAVELYALASCHPYVGDSQWFEDVAGAEIAAAAKGLPPEVVSAAQERGRARDLWETMKELLAELEQQELGHQLVPDSS